MRDMILQVVTLALCLIATVTFAALSVVAPSEAPLEVIMTTIFGFLAGIQFGEIFYG